VHCSADGTIVHNPNAMPIWATVDERIVRIDAGQTVRLG
jgi:peptidoglycan-N-acetylglucosamine deacetylase